MRGGGRPGHHGDVPAGATRRPMSAYAVRMSASRQRRCRGRPDRARQSPESLPLLAAKSLNEPMAADQRRSRSRIFEPGGPIVRWWASRSSDAVGPSATSRTEPSAALATHPVSPRRLASVSTKYRYPTPCTRPPTVASSRSRSRAEPGARSGPEPGARSGPEPGARSRGEPVSGLGPEPGAFTRPHRRRSDSRRSDVSLPARSRPSAATRAPARRL